MGNLTTWNGNSYQYDAFNQMSRMTSGSESWIYVYTAGDERFWSYRVGGGGSLWALRDLDGRLLREYEAHTSWSSFKDYVYRGAQLVGFVHSTQGTRHFHLDHLGTPRLVTSGSSGGDFYTLAPCRALDTRTQSAPLSAGETRTVTLAGVCGIPSSATAVSVNFTVVDATAAGEMTAWPSNEPKPTASAISYQVGANWANNGMQKLGNGALSFYANQATGTAHLVIDVNGYYTEDAGTVLAYHVYYPFGEEATAFNQDSEQMKFTGHERDLASAAGAGDDLDYMHARHASPFTGRFLSVDPQLGGAKQPQSWNRYAYVRDNPLTYLDPDGAEVQLAYGHHTPTNFFGHVALVVNGRVYSFDTHWARADGDWGVPLDDYLKSQQTRETEVLTLDVTGVQEKKIEQALMDQNPYGNDEYDVLSNSCVTLSENALESAGVLPNQPGPVTVDQSGNELQAGAPKSITPGEFVARVRAEGLVTGVRSYGQSKVNRPRSLWGTIMSYVKRFVP